jgi:hypothetical protein
MEQVSWIAPARWGFAALGATDDLNDTSKLGNPALRTDPIDSLWKHSAGTWVTDIVAGVLLGVVALALTAWMLRRIEPKVTRPAAAAVPAPPSLASPVLPPRLPGMPVPPHPLPPHAGPPPGVPGPVPGARRS